VLACFVSDGPEALLGSAGSLAGEGRAFDRVGIG
jgi:hypothetical protein